MQDEYKIKELNPRRNTYQHKQSEITRYTACFIREESGYSVIFPDWKCAMTYGKDFNEAMSMAIDLLAAAITFDKEDGVESPKPTPLEQINLSELCTLYECSEKDIILCDICVDVEKYAERNFNKPVKNFIRRLLKQ